MRVEITYILSFADLGVLNNRGLNSCGWCMGNRGDRDRPGVGKDEGNGGGVERKGSDVDGTEEGTTGEEVGVCRRERGEDPVVDVDDRLDGKGMGGEKHQLGAVEEEGICGGMGYEGFRVEQVEGKSLWVGFYF